MELNDKSNNNALIMGDDCGVGQGESETQCRISLLLLKSIKGPPGLTSPPNGRITINSTYAFTSYALQRYFGFNRRIFGPETMTEVLRHISPNSIHRDKLKIPTVPG